MTTTLEPPVPPQASPPVSPLGPTPGIVAVRVVGTLVAVLIVGGACLGVVARFFHQERTETVTYRQPVTHLVLDGTTSDVRVRAGAPGSAVVVRRTMGWSFGTVGSAETVTDGTLQITPQCSVTFGLGWCSVDYEITAPPDVALALATHTGDITVDGAAGEVSATSHTGDVTLTGLRTDRVSVTTSTGDIQLRFAVAPTTVRAEASTGDVEIVVPDDATSYAVRTSTSTGDQQVSVPVSSDAPRSIDARTSTGDILVRAAR